MPARDKCEPQVIRALQKAGWKIVKQHFVIRIGKTRHSKVNDAVYADLLMQYNQQQILVVEIKCFSGKRPYLDDFYHALGQYLVYRDALRMKIPAYPIYLVMPSEAYDELTNQDSIQRTIKNVKMNLIVMDLDVEEIIAWIDSP